MAKERDSNYSLERRKSFSLLLQHKLTHFTQPRSKAWLGQLQTLFSRRSRLMWLSFRNFGGAWSNFLAVFVTSYIFESKAVFFFYHLVSSFGIIPVEDIIQRSLRKFNLTLNVSGVSSFQYHLANIAAHFVFFLFAYLLLYMLLFVTGNFQLDLTYEPLLFMVMLVLGIIATASFAQFFALLVNDAMIGLGVFSFLVYHISFFLFSLSFYIILLIPPTFFCYAITQHLATESE